MRAYTHRGGAHRRVSTFWLRKTHKFFLCSGWDSNFWSGNPLDIELDALPIEPPHPLFVVCFSVNRVVTAWNISLSFWDSVTAGFCHSFWQTFLQLKNRVKRVIRPSVVWAANPPPYSKKAASRLSGGHVGVKCKKLQTKMCQSWRW